MKETTKALAFRPATFDDAAFAADVMTAVRPDSPNDPVVMRYVWESDAGGTWTVRRFIIQRDDQPIGFAWYEHPPWDAVDERWALVTGELLPAERERHLDALFARMEDGAAGSGATRLRARAHEADPLRIATLERRGYREARRQRDWELDLVAHRGTLAAMSDDARARMRREGVRILTLDADPDPDKYVKAWRLSEEAVQDIPTTVPHVAEPLDEFMKWIRRPGLREDRIWIARLGEDIVGISFLSYPPVRGIVFTNWTGTARAARGRGIARALKCETVMQAIAAGVDRVRTGDDEANAPILHLNESMGYRPIPGWIEFVRAARATDRKGDEA